jgi:nicotinamidase-related amidase
LSAPALLIIDVQKGLDDPMLGKRNNPGAEACIEALLNHWRRRSWQVIHVGHDSLEAGSPLRPELPGNAFKPEALPLPGEQQFRKTTNSAFVGTGLEGHLRDNGITELVVVGLTTDHCVSATTRMASDLGFEVTVVADATATHERKGYDGRNYSADMIHRVSLVSLDGEFCSVLTSDDLLKEGG